MAQARVNDQHSQESVSFAESILLNCGKHYGVRSRYETNHCYKCKPHVKHKFVGRNMDRKFNHIVTGGHAPSRRDCKDRAKRNMDQLGDV